MKVVTKITYEDRISGLRKTLFFPPNEAHFIAEVSLERAKIITRAYQENEGLPAELLRAKALEKILDEMPIYISEGQLLAGNAVSRPRVVEVFPEYSVNWMLDELDTISTREADKYKISDNDKGDLKTICQWWQGRTVQDRVRVLLGEEEYWYKNRLVFHSNPGENSGNNTVCPDYPKILRLGLNGIIAEAEGKLGALDLSDPKNLEKKVFYDGVILSLKATIRYAHRYAELARKLAKENPDPYRRAELEKIAEVCEWVPANPARDFHEAVQTVMFIHAVLCLDAAAFIWMPGRLDQYLYPYFRKDIDEGKLTKESAQELLECLFIKFNDSKIFWSALHGLYFSGNPCIHIMTIGGVDKNGRDATNELSYLILDGMKHLLLQQPEVLVPIHKDMPDALLRSTCELVRMGTGHPKIACLEAMQKMKRAEGLPYTLEDLRNIVWAGCGEIHIPGKEKGGPDFAYFTGLCVALELALNNGKSRLTGEQWGLETGDPRKFKSFDEVMEAWKKQMAFGIKHACTHRGAIVLAQGQLTPSPYRSAFVDNCIERGLDITKGGAKYNADSGSNIGVTTCGDALAGIKKVVFDDKKLSMSELIDALDANFEGKEELRQTLLSAPKFGNDDDYADLIVREIGQFANREHRKHPELFGGIQRSTHVSVTAGIPVGRGLGATPDGRKAQEPLNDGGISPHYGRDKNGPTAVMKSVSKVDWEEASGGCLNMKFTTNALQGEEGIQMLMALLRAYDRMGGYHVQFNCVDIKTLRDAMEHPENYQDLLVRVGAYSAYFTMLSKTMQEDIIARTAHNRCGC